MSCGWGRASTWRGGAVPFTRHRAFCSWCLLAAGATLAAVPLVIPEGRRARRRLLGRG